MAAKAAAAQVRAWARQAQRGEIEHYGQVLAEHANEMLYMFYDTADLKIKAGVANLIRLGLEEHLQDCYQGARSPLAVADNLHS